LFKTPGILDFSEVAQQQQQDTPDIVHSLQHVLNLLHPLATSHWHLLQFQCQKALDALSVYQPPSGWTYCEMGKCYSEQGQFSDAERCFEKARRLEPWRLQSMEVYSTVLWHLRKASKLSYLAHELVDLDKESPQSWCAVGNCFSLLKEHDAALGFFKRAIQVDSSFAYAYTLGGHEFVANDDLEQAIAYFRNALRCDARHYNAWYGLGMIFYRTQRLSLAHYHFGQALAINGQSSALYTYQGMVMNKLKNYTQALRAFDIAIKHNPKNVLAKSKKAQVLINMDQLFEAMTLLDALLSVAPKESFLHFLKGTVYAKQQDRESALVSYTTALDLDSKNNALIKSHIERIHTGSSEFADLNLEDELSGEEEFDIVG